MCASLEIEIEAEGLAVSEPVRGANDFRNCIFYNISFNPSSRPFCRV